MGATCRAFVGGLFLSKNEMSLLAMVARLTAAGHQRDGW